MMPWYENRKGDALWYEDVGTGSPIVLIHGWCMSSAIWKYQLEGLAASYRLLAPDLRGHGSSCEVTGDLNFDSFANDLADLFDTLNISNGVLVGWSMGAQIALQSYAGLSDRLAALVLVSATPCFTASDDFPYGLAKNEAHGMRIKVERNTKRALAGFHTRLFGEGEIESHPAASEILHLLSTIPSPDTSAVLDALDALAHTDMRHILSSISIPTLIVNGGQDRVCLPEASDYLKEHISGAEQKYFPDCGHVPFLTRSQQFNAEIIRFARSVSGKYA
jgi:pimeloyl-[acyl-carrier protein] methyl ester esterase